MHAEPRTARVGELLVRAPKSAFVPASEYEASGTIPVVDQGDGLIAGYVSDQHAAYDGPLPVVVFGDHTCRLKYVDFVFARGAQGTQVLVPNADVNPRFFYYALHTIDLVQFGYQRHFKYLKDARIPVPPRDVQDRVAEALRPFEELIANIHRRIELLEETLRLTYRDLIAPYGALQNPALSTRMGAPERWTSVPIREVLALHIGGGWGSDEPSVEESSAAVVVRGTDVPRLRSRLPADCPVRYHGPKGLEKRLLEPGDIVMEVSGGSKGQPVGRALMASDSMLAALGGTVICASFCKLLRIDASIVRPELVYLGLLELYDTGAIDRFQVQSTGITNLKFQDFLDGFQVVVPGEKSQRAFIAATSPVFRLIDTLGRQSESLCEARDLLLPRLVSGEITVSDLPNEAADL